LIDLLEGKLVVLRFQIKIKDELEAIASRSRSSSDMSGAENGSVHDSNVDAECQNCKRKGHRVILGFKELYNEYAVPFEIWEVHLFLPNPHRTNQLNGYIQPLAIS
jgi:nuclear pore complex protein Nup155